MLNVIPLKLQPVNSRAASLQSNKKQPWNLLSGRIPWKAALMSGEVLICRTPPGKPGKTMLTSRLPNQGIFGVKVRNAVLSEYARGFAVVSA